MRPLNRRISRPYQWRDIMPNRYVCEALSELRTALDLQAKLFDIPERSQVHVLSLLEEIQTYVNRMEASLGDKWDMKRMQEERSNLAKERRELRQKVEDLREELAEYEEEDEEEE